MKLERIEHYKEKFKLHLKETEDFSELYKYECLQNFTTHWDLSDVDLLDRYTNSLTSSITGRLWGGTRNSAKSMMQEFINLDREYMRSVFRDLFDEDKDLTGRIQRFRFHCDQLLMELREAKKKITTHYHNEKMISLYLSFNNPQKYSLYSYKAFAKMMAKIELQETPQVFELERFFKISTAIYNIISKDEELMSLHKGLRSDHIFYQKDTMLIVHDFFAICSHDDII